MSYDDIIENLSEDIVEHQVFKMLLPLFAKLKIKKFKIKKDIFYAYIYNMYYEFQIIEDEKNKSIDVYYVREDGGKNIITEKILEEHDHITAPFLEKVSDSEYDAEDSMDENLCDPAIARFFLCKGDMYICHEACFVKNPCVHKQKTLYRVI